MKIRRFLSSLAAFAVVAGIVLQQGDVSAASLTSQVQLLVKADLTDTSGLVEARAPLVMQRILTLASGDAANEASVVWSDSRTIVASGSETLDFAGGGLTDPFGAAVEPAKIRAIVVSAAAGNQNDVVIGNDVNHVPILSDATTTVTIQPGGIFVLTAPALAGVAVTAGTGDIIAVANSGAGSSVDYSIVVLGTAS